MSEPGRGGGERRGPQRGGPQLVGVFCPCCHQRTHTVALGTGPQLIQHRREWTADGERRRCQATWVAVPDEATGRVHLTPVVGRREIDQTLAGAAQAWLHARAAREHALFQAMFVADPAPSTTSTTSSPITTTTSTSSPETA